MATLKSQRNALSLTQKDLTEALNSCYGTKYTPKQVSQVENGKENSVLIGDIKKFFSNQAIREQIEKNLAKSEEITSEKPSTSEKPKESEVQEPLEQEDKGTEDEKSFGDHLANGHPDNQSDTKPKAKEDVIRLNGTEIRAMRKTLGLSQEKLALALGLKRSSSAAVCDWEKDRISIPLRHQTSLKIMIDEQSTIEPIEE